MVKSLHLEIGDVENTIYNFDNSVIDFETLSQLKQQQATPDELVAIKGHVSGCPDVPLDAPDQFLLDLSGISNFNDRLRCFMFQAQFTDSLSDIENKLNNIKHVCETLTSSQAMKQVLSVILACGNYMNGGNHQRGQADGFAIDILPKVKDVKSKDNSVNLLQYVVRFCILRFDAAKGSPSAACPVPEPTDVEKCACVNFDDARADVRKIGVELAAVRRATDKVTAEGEPEHREPFAEKMAAFLVYADQALAEMLELVAECSNKFVQTLIFYQFKPKPGETLTSTQPKDYFCLWVLFCQDYKNLWKKEQLRIEKDLIKEERLAIKQKKETLKDFKTEPKKRGGLKEKLLNRRSRLKDENQD